MVLVTHFGSFPLDSKVQRMIQTACPGLEEVPSNIADGESGGESHSMRKRAVARALVLRAGEYFYFRS